MYLVESQSRQLGSRAGEDELRTAKRTKRQTIKSDVSVDLSPALRISMEPVLQSTKALPLKIREYNCKIVEP
jgi:hypothetical protein